MDIYVDSANLNEIKAAKELGLCDGVTTNPTLIAKEGGSFTEILKKICEVVSGPVHAEVLSLDYAGILSEGRELAKIAENIVVKIPMLEAGLKAAKTLKEEGIPTNITLIFSAAQAILAAKAGATYICPFLGRLDDIGHDGLQLLGQIRAILDNNPDLDTQIIAASIRTPLHMVELSSMGVDILTAPEKVLKQMQKHPLTDAGIAQFLVDAKKFAH
ncbi:MAG: fructose-6-phosphate aldolase [Candidatus Lambdaproteobacteria bacterium RIFOXYD1_FULL_56_27]|uniref:Fructose-6-phosphate aldolase n=1 Tax=Candidatus Lambdaproteobacteria bacterium RIFOXYD2_FULL_56_26 TaxID=1817773 RepID=A0A1F6H308_9PROT|nr:MAG: fructose-6-phosphate aldolase [Candidatus Lambdaproteobacteria bacterium RIFOXYD2_FULL_56_26]OGH05398.1 MAG: fructose-6-phosphate aldolase [Candidatus Lambdaproteobacteria bacterium RIFOXYC1_FULL_56_13]OGH09242.1 MAG: fructose-6-phosphate aldolase [Candidatus Lambdaproteobacteria bacterium RIFOXYD1_FULL_56_27]